MFPLGVTLRCPARYRERSVNRHHDPDVYTSEAFSVGGVTPLEYAAAPWFDPPRGVGLAVPTLEGTFSSVQ